MPPETRYFTIRSLAQPDSERDSGPGSVSHRDDGWDDAPAMVGSGSPGVRFESWSRARCWAVED